MKSVGIYLLNFLVVLLPAQYMHAQTVSSSHAIDTRQHIKGILQKQEDKKHELRAAARNTSFATERLLAHTTYDYYPFDSIMGLSDTAKFYYSSSARGSVFNYSTLSYNDNWYWGSYDAWYGRTLNTLGRAVTSAKPNYFAQVFCDSSRHYYYRHADTSGVPFFTTDTFRTYETYNGNNDVASYNSFSGISHFEALYNWDGHNNTNALYINYSPYFDTNGATISIFNSSGQLIEDSIVDHSGGTARPLARVIYSYDGAGNLVNATGYNNNMGTWGEYLRWNMTYNSDNFIKKDSFSQKMLFGPETGSWVTDHVDSFGYTTGVNYYTFWRTNYYNDSTYPLVTSSSIYSKHINSAGLPDTLYVSRTGYVAGLVLVPFSKQVFVYDSYRNPVVSYQFNYSITDTATGAGYYSASPDFIDHFYYEDYLSNAGVIDETAGEEITIYPNPSRGTFSLSAKGKIDNARAIVFNNVGQVVFEKALSNAATQIEISAQPNGIYFVEVVNEANEILKTGKLVKME